MAALPLCRVSLTTASFKAVAQVTAFGIQLCKQCFEKSSVFMNLCNSCQISREMRLANGAVLASGQLAALHI